MNDLHDDTDLKRSAPTLFGLPKADPFGVPKGFFDTFPHEVQARVAAKQPKGYTWSIWKRVVIALPVLAVLGLGVWWALGPEKYPGAMVAVTATPFTEAELDALGDDELLALTEEVMPLTGTADELGTVDLDLNDEELLAYLESEGADINELITTE